VILKPQPAGDLTWAKGSYRSPIGEIVSDWKLDGQRLTWKVGIPANSDAVVYIPSIDGRNITVDGVTLENSRFEDGYAIVELGSGDYTFVSTFKKP
jgi:alpha-L-rhamnosidase